VTGYSPGRLPGTGDGNDGTDTILPAGGRFVALSSGRADTV
jgi:hypothetical protein